MQHNNITDNLDILFDVLPPQVAEAVHVANQNENLLEIVLDLGRKPEARYTDRELILSDQEVTQGDIDLVVARIGEFDADNRAGMERTLHRISAIRNRRGHIVGLTCRVGRAVYGTIDIIEDIVAGGKSIGAMTFTDDFGAANLLVVCRQGDSYAAADLAGTWQINALTSGDDAPLWSRGGITVQSNGDFSGTLARSSGGRRPGASARWAAIPTAWNCRAPKPRARPMRAPSPRSGIAICVCPW